MNLIIIESSTNEKNTELIMEHFPTHVTMLRSIHNNPAFSNIWGVDEILFNQINNDVYVFQFLPEELKDLIIISTIYKFLRNHMFKKAAKLMFSKKYYLNYFGKIMLGTIFSQEHFRYSRIDSVSRSMFAINIIHTEIMKSVNTSDCRYIVNEITTNIKPSSTINTLYPWHMIKWHGTRSMHMHNTILEIEQPDLGIPFHSFNSFSIGNTFGDLVWAKGRFNRKSGFFRAEKLMWPVIPIMFCTNDNDASIFLDMNRDWASMNCWSAFEQFYKIIYGKHTTILLATNSDEDSPYSFFNF